LELFFDLVVVFAFTQVTQLMSDDLTWRGIGRGLLVLAAIWWAWTGYAWLTNALEPEEGQVRAGMFGAMAAMLVVALAVPGAFGADAVLFGVAYLLVRLLNLVLYAIAGRRDPDLLRALIGFAPAATIGPVCILLAGFVDGGAQTALWGVGLAVLYGGALIGRGRGWHISPAHFAERYGLIVIIALGESIIALGVGAAGFRFPPASSPRPSWVSSLWPRSGGRISTSSPSCRNVNSRRRPGRREHGSPATTTATCTSR
jgi:low temperature requirement protein LtrA